MNRGGMDETWRALLSARGRHRSRTWFPIVAGILLLTLGCGKPPDQMVYEEIVATMSMERAKRFFEDYPQSPYRDRLVDQIVAWCEKESTRECYGLILEALPRDHARYREVAAYYEKRFGTAVR